MGEEARGSFIWTVIHGRAFEVVEHLKNADYQVKVSDNIIFDLLDKRPPDEIGENIASVFSA